MENNINSLVWIIGWGLWPAYFAFMLLAVAIGNKIINAKNIQIADKNYNSSYDDKKLFQSDQDSYMFFLIIID